MKTKVEHSIFYRLLKVSRELAEAKLLQAQANRFEADRTQFPTYSKPGKLIAVNSSKNLAVAQNSDGNVSSGQPLSNALPQGKTRTSTLNNGSIDYRSAGGA